MADPWDIEGEENEEWQGIEEEKKHSGAEDYMIVLHYKGLNVKHFRPQQVMLGHDGKPLMSNYSKTVQRTEDGTPESVYRKKTIKWQTKSEDLARLDNLSRNICNNIKSFLTKQQVAVFYHNANIDECSQYGGAHLHIVLHSERMCNQKARPIGNITAYRTLKKKIYENGGYCKNQGVRCLEKALEHFNTKPRVYMGTNYVGYFNLMKPLQAPTGRPAPKMSEFVSPISDDEDETETVVREWSGFEDEAPTTSKREHNGFSDEEFVVEPPKKKAFTVQESDSDRLQRLARMLCLRWNAYNIPDLYKSVASLAQMDLQEEQKYITLFNRLMTRPKFKSAVETTKFSLEAEYMFKPFKQLVKEYCLYPEDYSKITTPYESYKVFCQWCTDQGIELVNVIQEIVDIMDRKREKINTFCLIGESNSGKTMVVSNPLKAISRFVGQIGNRGSNSQFVYQDCPNKRLIVIDECVMTREQLEDMKLLLGGEDLKADVKGKMHTTVGRTPVIMTGNKDLWVLDQSQRDPLLNRMVYYNTKTVPDLKYCKPLSPKMWWFLEQLYDNPMLTFDEMEPLPEMDFTLNEDPLE